MKQIEKWRHIRRLIECAIKSNIYYSTRKSPLDTKEVVSYAEGKARAYQTVLGWMIDLENNQLLFQDNSTIITDERFIKIIEDRIQKNDKKRKVKE